MDDYNLSKITKKKIKIKMYLIMLEKCDSLKNGHIFDITK
jgi:hypothetical protein